MPGRTVRTPFVGRRQEMARLRANLDAAPHGEGGLVLVVGEPGIGKTRLLTELAEDARTRGWLVLWGRAYDTEGMPPYLPFVEALRPHIAACPPDDLRAQLGSGAAEIALILPSLRDRLPGLPAAQPPSPDYERYRLFESVTEFLLAIARGGEGIGLLLILDDLHWADKPTLLLLQYLARHLTGAPLIVAGTYRTTDIGQDHPLTDVLADLHRERLAERLILAPFASTDVAALIEGVTNAPPAVTVVEAIERETEGNPFFIEEVVEHLRLEGRDLTAPDAVGRVWSIPEGVRAVISRRLARLGAATNQMLQVSAVLGEAFTFDVLAAAGEIEHEQLLIALDEALNAGLLREEEGGYRFTHALIRETVRDGLSLPRRQRFHLRAAEAIERVHARRLAPHAGALALHYRLAGTAADPAKGLAYLQQAAEAALAVFAWEEAAAHLQLTELLFSHYPDERAEAVTHLDFAIGELREMGMQPALDRALALQERLDAGPSRRATPAHPDGLSQREVEVLRLLAAGHTNQEIADALVLSVRTVENHTASIYAKIGARSRAEATAYAFRQNLV